MRKSTSRQRLGAALILLACLGCTQRYEAAPEALIIEKEVGTRIFGADIPETDLVPGRLNVYVSEELALELEQATDPDDGIVRLPAVKSLPTDGIVRMRRLFPDAGRFEARTRAEGLHRWYELRYEEGVSTTKAAEGLALPGVDLVEYSPQIHIVGDPVVTGYVESDADDGPKSQSAATSLFDDPNLPRQWHYYNDGSNKYTVSGCDVNVIPVWRSGTTGNPDVIVGVVDGGVDYKHEDLAANMWNNPDNTGEYIYGYNFTNNTYKVNPESHGTHVAGTIAAVNNNGTGVCGIAGGNAKKNQKGVKIMSCQIFDGDEQGSGASAIKWSADHGAVISQNSWGYTNATTTPASLKGAVDYFIKYAGINESGKQTGPMKGGIVIFAAGNENTSVSGNDYEPIINVSAVGADYIRAYYSNYGSWLDIAAPGGDVKKGNQVLSTLPSNRYGYMQGTSMACPHVSGVAALILSKNGKSGYTASALEKALLNGVTNITSFNPNYNLGQGLVNAYKSISGSGGKAPNTPTGLAATAQSNTISFSVQVPTDPDDGLPNTISIYYANQDFKETGNNRFAQFYIGDLQSGETLTGSIPGLDFNKTYFVAAVAGDLAGNQSKVSARVMVNTGGNHAPEINGLDDYAGVERPSVTIKPHETAKIPLEVVEPDGHFVLMELEGARDGVVLDTMLVREQPKITIQGPKLPSGKGSARLIVTDEFGLSSEKSIDYTVLENHKPYVSRQFEDMIFNSRSAETTEFDVIDYFIDEDGENLTYLIDIDNNTVVNLTQSGTKFYLTPMNYGYANIRVTGTDVRGETVSQSLKVLVRDGTKEVDLYPNPVRTDLNIRTSEDATVALRIVSASGSCFYDGTVQISPFNPASVDMRKATPGVYTVLLEIGGKQLKYNIVKL